MKEIKMGYFCFVSHFFKRVSKAVFFTLLLTWILAGCSAGSYQEKSADIEYSLSKSEYYNQGSNSGIKHLSVEDAVSEIRAIWEEEKTNIAGMIKEIRTFYQSYPDEEVFLMENCGPASISFQKKLIDRGYWVEVRTNEGLYKYHEYLLYRAELVSGEVKTIIIDAAFRQFFRQYVYRHIEENLSGNNNVNAVILSDEFMDILQYDLLIVESYAEINDYFTQTFLALHNSEFSCSYNFEYFNAAAFYEEAVNPDSELQMIYTRYLDNETIEYLKYISGDRYMRNSSVVIYYAEFESATKYYLHAYNGIDSDIEMQYHGFYNNKHWWKASVRNDKNFQFCFYNTNNNWDGVDRNYYKGSNEVYLFPFDSNVYNSINKKINLTVKYKEFESSQAYFIHIWGNNSGNYIMEYEGYYNGGHWWRVDLKDISPDFNFCFFNSNNNWDGVPRFFSSGMGETAVFPYTETYN